MQVGFQAAITAAVEAMKVSVIEPVAQEIRAEEHPCTGMGLECVSLSNFHSDCFSILLITRTFTHLLQIQNLLGLWDGMG